MLRVIAAMLGLRRTRQLNTPKHGFNMIIWSRLPEGDGYGETAAFGVAVALALKGATGLAQKRVDGLQVARAVVQGAKEVFDEDIPMASAVTSALGRRRCAILMEHGADPNMQWIPLPKQCAVASFDTGANQPIDEELRLAAEVGAGMALANLNVQLKKEKKPAHGGWGQISPGDFEGGIRDFAPTKEVGADWLKRFRLTEPELAELVVPDRPYRERALAEHQVRETARVKRFVSQITEYSRTLREGFLVEAGRCLHSSHRSFKEKCNIAYEDGDSFIEALKEKGRSHGLFGARLTESGGTGVMAVLSHQSGLQNLRDLGTAYQKKHKKGGAVTSETGDGGVLTGWWEGVLEPAVVEEETVESAVDDDKAGKAAKDGKPAKDGKAKSAPTAKSK
jgi:galactokinase